MKTVLRSANFYPAPQVSKCLDSLKSVHWLVLPGVGGGGGGGAEGGLCDFLLAFRDKELMLMSVYS